MRRIRWKIPGSISTSLSRILLPFITLFILFPFFVYAQEAEQFGMSDFEPEPFYVPLQVDGSVVGEINTIPREELTTEVDARELLSLLRSHVAADRLQELEKYSETWISIEQMQDYPFGITFNMFDLVVEVSVPPESTISREISLSGSRDPLTYELIEPADISFYTNIHSSFTFGNYDRFGDENSEVKPSVESSASLRATFYPTLNVHGWVVDSRFSLNTTENTTFRYGALQLSREWLDIPLRLLAGDITYRTADYQTNTPYFGAAISRDPSRSFQKRKELDFEYSFLVPSDNALVSVLMNGRSIRRERLNANMYTLTDFYFNNGLNKFEVEIEEEGDVTAEEFFFAYDSRLIPRGKMEFTAGFGYRDRDFTTWPEAFGMQKIGITNHASGEYFFQAGRYQQNIGGSVLYATPLGNIKLGGALSAIGLEHFGFLTSINYRYSRPGSGVNRSFSFTGSYTDKNYAPFRNISTLPTEDRAWDLSASYSQTLLQTIGMNLSVNVSIPRNENLITSSISADFTTQLTNNITLGARTRGSWGESGFEPNVTLRASVRPGNKDVSVTAQQSVTGGGNNLSAYYRPESLEGKASFNFSAAGVDGDDPLPDSMSYGGSYSHTNYALSGNQRISRGKTETSYITTLNVNTAISYADGLFGISRPIADSFLLVDLSQDIEDYILGINPTGSGYLGRTDEFGAAVVHNITSFSSHTITIEPIEIPDGYEMGTDRYTFRPTYHQGAALNIEVISNVTIEGRIVFSDGSPAGLYTGEVVREDTNQGEESVFFFTNEDGYYELYGLRSGSSYKVTLFMGEGITFTLSVPEGKTGVLQAKELVIPVSYKVF